MLPAVAVPADLLQRILLESDYPTIRSVAEASRLFSFVARPILWDHIFIDNKRNSPVPSTVLSLIRSLSLTAFPQDCLMRSLSGMSSLEELVLDCSMDASSWETLLSFLGPEKLRRLSISKAAASLLKDGTLMKRLGNLCCRQMDYLQIESLIQLDHLSLFISRLQPQSLLVNTPRIPHFNHLRSLDASNTDLSPNDLLNLPSTIRDLSVINCPNLNTASLLHFGANSQIRLRSLEFSLDSLNAPNEHTTSAHTSDAEVSFLALPAFSGIVDLLAHGSQFQNAHLEKAALALPELERIILDRAFINVYGLTRALGAHRACKEVIIISSAKVIKESLVEFLERSGTAVERVIAIGCSRLNKYAINRQLPNEIIFYSTLSSHNPDRSYSRHPQTVLARMTFVTPFDHILRPFARHVAQFTRLPSWRLRGFLRRHDVIQRKDDGISRRRPSVHGSATGGGRLIEEEQRVTMVATTARPSSSSSLLSSIVISPPVERVLMDLIEKATHIAELPPQESPLERKIRHQILATMSAKAHAHSLTSMPWGQRVFGVMPEKVTIPEYVKLGEGGYKTQQRGVYRMNKIEFSVAVGITKNPIRYIGQYGAFMEEVQAAQNLDHSGMVRTYGGYIRENDDRGVIISELADMNLAEYICKRPDPGPFVKLGMIRQLMAAVEYLHTKTKLIHGDLKLRNIVVFETADSLSFARTTTTATTSTTSTVLINRHDTASPPIAQPQSPTNLPSIATTLPMTATAATGSILITSSTSQPPSPISHRRAGRFSGPIPIVKITDFSTLSPISSQYGEPGSLIQHAENYHRHGTLLIRPPEADQLSPPTPSTDIYALGILFYSIIAWTMHAPEPFATFTGSALDRYFRNSGGIPNLSLVQKFFGTFGECILKGMVEPSVERRWDLEKVKAGWDEFEAKLTEQLERASIVNSIM